MRSALFCLFAVILVAPVYGQTGTSSNSPSQPTTVLPGHKVLARPNSRTPKGARYKPEITVNTPVVTLEGVCSQPVKGAPKTDAPCKTVITRGQLDVLQDAIDPEASPKAHQLFAISYARMLAAAQLAELQHLDMNPEVAREIQVQQKIVRLQILTSTLIQSLQKKAGVVPTKELEAYYKKYASTFEQAEVQRLAIPLNAPTVSGKPLDAAAAKDKLEELRTRVLAGDNFDDLQARAYKELEIKGDVPHTTISLMQRGGLTLEEAKVFEMDMGETSPVFDNQGILMLLRVVSRKTLPLEEVRSQIDAVMFQQRMMEELRDATKDISAEFNLKYMDSPTQPELFPPNVLSLNNSRRGMLSSLHVQP